MDLWLLDEIQSVKWNTVERCAVVVTKIDKLSRTKRLRAIGEYEAVFEHAVTAVSAVTGEGLDELWILIDKLKNGSHPKRRRSQPGTEPPKSLVKLLCQSILPSAAWTQTRSPFGPTA